MGAKSRLFLCAFLIVISAAYSALISIDPQIAGAVALGYICLVLTVFVAINAWRRT